MIAENEDEDDLVLGFGGNVELDSEGRSVGEFGQGNQGVVCKAD